MRRLALIFPCLLAACAPGGAATPRVDRDPVVVELYQSQGCSSCPPANANLNAVAGRPDVLALSFAVTYWDQLGWKDRFARPEFTKRQWDYANAAKRGRVYTPQVIVNGRAMMLGGDKAHFNRLIAAGGPTGGPSITGRRGNVELSGPRPARPATIWLVRYDPRVHNVAIRAGENGGRTLPHRNIVTELRVIGTWTGRPVTLAVGPVADRALRSAILIQQGTGGPIVAARRI